MSSRMESRKFSAILLFLAAVIPSIHAQRTTATYNGTVVDPSGAVVPSAEVELANDDTGNKLTGVSDANGEFVFNYVPVGNYTLRITAAGFKTFQDNHFPLSAAQNVRQKFTLTVGQSAESVTVTEAAPPVNTASSEQRTNFSTREVENVPLPNRNISRVLEVSTGLTREAGQPGTGGGRVRLNGLGGSSVRITANGTDASGNAGAPGLSQYLQFNKIDVMSIEAVGEVQVVKGVVAAEYGPAMGGNVNLITKSGTNQWHGSAFERYEGAILDARQQFLTTKPNHVWNQYGGSLGGPVLKDKAFFFVAYEGYQETVPRVLTGNVPTPYFRDIMLRALPYPETQLSLNAFPLPNRPTTPTALLGVYQGAGRQIAKDDHYDSRGDIRLWNGNLSLTYTRGHPYFVQPSVEAINARQFNSRTDRFATSYVIGRGQWTAETRFGYNRNYMARLDGFLNVVDPNTPETIPFGRRVTALRFTGMDDMYQSELHRRGLAPTYSFEQQLSYVRGKHSFKFGGLFMRPAGGRPDADNGGVSFQTLQDLLTNTPSQVATTFGVNENIWRMKQFGFFVQDDWRATQNLVFNIGMRYDYFGKAVSKPTDPKNPAGYFNRDGLLDSSFHFGPVRDPNDPYKNDALNLAPRFGFAYNVGGTNRNIIRGGFGIMFQSFDPQVLETGFSNSAVIPFRSTFSKLDAASYGLKFPTYNETVLPLVLRLNKPATNDVLNPNVDAPYAMNFSLSYQRALTSTLALESAFVGTRGVKFLMTRTYNPVNRLTGIRPNPELGGQALYNDNSQQSSYYSWQTSLRKQVSHNLSFNLNYTYGKGMSNFGGDISRSFNGDASDNIQDFFNTRIEHGPSAGDITHLFVANWVYFVPTLQRFAGSSIGRQVFGGWEVSGIFRANTGEPIQITQSSQIPSSRPDLVNLGAAINGTCCAQSLQYLNPAAFALVPVSSAGATIRRGNIGNNALRGPSYSAIDISLAKNFRLRERVNFEIRSDFLNALNQTNFTSVVTEITRSNFGQVTNTTGARAIQIQGRLHF